MTISPVIRSCDIAASLEHAFDVFTIGIARWWDKDKSINQGIPMREAVLEPFAGGRWYERGEDGSECEWGKVLIWDRPNRLVLAWQINAQWAYDANLITEVDIVFTATDSQHTRVDLEHRNLERFGDQALAARGALDSPGGWSGLLEAFRAAI